MTRSAAVLEKSHWGCEQNTEVQQSQKQKKNKNKVEYKQQRQWKAFVLFLNIAESRIIPIRT